MSKKVLIASILVMTMIFSFATMSYASTTPTVTIGNLTGNQGEEKTVDIVLTNNTGLIILEFYVAFDNTALELTNVEFSEEVLPDNKTKFIHDTCNAKGQQKIQLGSDEGYENEETGEFENFTGNGIVASVTFNLLKNIAATDEDSQPYLHVEGLRDYAYDVNEELIDFTFAKEAPAGGETFETWVGGTRYENNKFLAIVKYSGNATEYGIRFNDFDFVAQDARDNIFAIEVEDVETDPRTSGVTAFAR